MADTLRRRVAELLGYTIVWRDGFWHLVEPSDLTHRWLGVKNTDGAWAYALEKLPAWDTDANAALALLAGDRLEWYANTVASGDRLWIEFVCSSAWVNPRAEGRGRAEVIDGDASATFARAACEAWCQWKEATA